MLLFDIRDVNYGPESPYAESLKIMVSTTDNQKASFTVLNDLGNLPVGNNSFAVNLSAYAGQNVYSGFRLLPMPTVRTSSLTMSR